MPGIDFEEVARRVTMAEVLRLIAWRPRRVEPAGARGRCPIHRSQNAKSTSFEVSEAGFHCFSCGAKGNQLRLFMEVRRLCIYDAAIQLCREAGIEIPYFSAEESRRRATQGTEKRHDIPIVGNRDIPPSSSSQASPSLNWQKGG